MRHQEVGNAADRIHWAVDQVTPPVTIKVHRMPPPRAGHELRPAQSPGVAAQHLAFCVQPASRARRSRSASSARKKLLPRHRARVLGREVKRQRHQRIQRLEAAREPACRSRRPGCPRSHRPARCTRLPPAPALFVLLPEGHPAAMRLGSMKRFEYAAQSLVQRPVRPAGSVAARAAGGAFAVPLAQRGGVPAFLLGPARRRTAAGRAEGRRGGGREARGRGDQRAWPASMPSSSTASPRARLQNCITIKDE